MHFIASACISQCQSANSVPSYQPNLHTGQSANTALNCSGPAQDNGLLRRGCGEDLREGRSHMLHFLRAAKTPSLWALEGTISRIEAVWVKIRRRSERKS